jgi:hypothetical protein
MIATCKTHGEVEFHVDKNKNAWCPLCRQEQFAEFLASEKGKSELSNVMHDLIPKKAVTSYKPGTPGWVPPPPRPFGEAAGIEPLYQEHYIRRVRLDGEHEE